MQVRKRTWTSPDGKKKSVYLMDYICPIDGQRRRYTLKGVTSKEHAHMLASAKYRDLCMKAGMGEAAPQSEAEKRLTLGQLMAMDLKRVGISPRTVQSEECHGKPLKHWIGEKTPVMAVTTAEVERFKARRKEVVSARTVNLSLELLRAMLNRAQNLGLISRIPCRIEKLAEKPVKHRFLSPEEISRMVSAAEGNLHDVVLLMASLGIKPCEVYRLTWGDVDFKGKLLYVESHKRGAGGVMARNPVPLTADLEKMFKRRLKESGGGLKKHIFPEKIGDRSVKRLARRAGIDHWEQVTAYTLRHSFATNLLLSGASVKDTQTLMRHTDPALTLRVYAQESMPSMRVAVDKLGSFKSQGSLKAKRVTTKSKVKAQ